MITLEIEYHEGGGVATIYLPGVYLNTDTDEYIFILLGCRLA